MFTIEPRMESIDFEHTVPISLQQMSHPNSDCESRRLSIQVIIQIEMQKLEEVKIKILLFKWSHMPPTYNDVYILST